MASFVKRTTKSKGQVWDVLFWVNDGEIREQKKLSGFPTKRDAERAYEKYLAGEREPAAKDKPSVSFRDAYDEYMSVNKNIIAASTLYVKKCAFLKYILPRFETRRLSDITRADIVAWQDDLWNMKGRDGKAPLSQITCKDIRIIFVTFMRWAVERYSLDENPFDGVAMPQRREMKKEKRIWSEKDFETFIENVEDAGYKAYFTVLFYSGCRKNEVNALTAEDFTKTADGHYTIKICKSVGYQKGRGMVETPPKTSSSNRTVSLPDTVTPLLDTFLEGKTGYLWNLYGQYIDKEFKRAMNETTLPRIRLHDLRHSHASILIACGIPVPTVSKRLGHSSSSTTLNVYSHAIDSSESDVLCVLDSLWEIVSPDWNLKDKP